MPDLMTQPDVSTFCITQEVMISAPIDTVWATLTKGVDDWWKHRSAHDNSKLSLEAALGGALKETWSTGGAIWGTVKYIDAPRSLRMTGPVGMKLRVHGSCVIELEPAGDGTRVEVTHHATGELDPAWRDAFSEGWHELLHTYLKPCVEQGVTWRDQS